MPINTYQLGRQLLPLLVDSFHLEVDRLADQFGEALGLHPQSAAAGIEGLAQSVA
jgi:hypothetical protein